MFRLSKSIRLTGQDRNAVVAEIKVHSPKHGDLLRGRDPMNILRAYENAGVCGVSYITEPNHFKGSIDLLKKICKETELPVLRKDFILDRCEIERTAEVEASAILLIARILKDKTHEFVDFAIEHGLDTVVEVHKPKDVEIATDTKTKIVGINNRDIGKLEVDDGSVEITEKLSPLIPNRFIKISESGIKSLDDLKRALRFADAVLIGTTFMLSNDVERTVRCFVYA